MQNDYRKPQNDYKKTENNNKEMENHCKKTHQKEMQNGGAITQLSYKPSMTVIS